MGRASLKRCLLAVQTQIVGFQTVLPSYGPRGVDTPKTNGVVRRVVEEPRLIDIRSHDKSVNLPGIDLAFDHKAVKAEPNIRAFSYIDQAPRTVFEFKPARAHCYRISSPGIADLQEPRMEVEFLFINWPRPAIPEGIQATFQVYKRANVFSVMNIETQHVS